MKTSAKNNTVSFPALLQARREKKDIIHERLFAFKETWEKGGGGLFKELCFCIFAANTSARMGIDTVNALGDALLYDSAENISLKLKGIYRFWRVRARYVVHTREYLKQVCGMNIKDYISSFSSVEEARNHFAENKNIMGIGYKEASHFFRNIGFFEFAILDKHVLKSLKELKVIKGTPNAGTRKRYLFIEGKMKRFSETTGIPMGVLDLLLWSGKTGEILK